MHKLIHRAGRRFSPLRRSIQFSVGMRIRTPIRDQTRHVGQG